jgi:hypothetical protein
MFLHFYLFSKEKPKPNYFSKIKKCMPANEIVYIIDFHNINDDITSIKYEYKLN